MNNLKTIGKIFSLGCKIIFAKKSKNTAIKKLNSADNGQSEYAALKALDSSKNKINNYNNAIQSL
jgi:hypothetical protein